MSSKDDEARDEGNPRRGQFSFKELLMQISLLAVFLVLVTQLDSNNPLVSVWCGALIPAVLATAIGGGLSGSYAAGAVLGGVLFLATLALMVVF